MDGVDVQVLIAKCDCRGGGELATCPVLPCNTSCHTTQMPHSTTQKHTHCYTTAGSQDRTRVKVRDSETSLRCNKHRLGRGAYQHLAGHTPSKAASNNIC